MRARFTRLFTVSLMIAPDAILADACATALSVLGEAGLQRLSDGVEAMLIVGDAYRYRVVTSEGFATYLESLAADTTSAATSAATSGGKE